MGRHLLLVLSALLPGAGCGDAPDPGPGPVLPGFVWRDAARCPLARFEAMGAAVGGRLFVFGGFVSSDLAISRRVDAYDLSTDTWTPLGDLPGAETHAAVAVDGSSIWMAGGFKGWPGTATQEVWRYDTTSDQWTSMPGLSEPRAALALVHVGDQLHAIGGLAADGTSDSGAHEVLALAGASAWTSAAPLPNPRNHLGAATLGDQAFVVGGRHGWDEQAGNQVSLDRFDATLGAWSAGKPIPVARSEINAATFSMGRWLVVVGGSINGASPSAQVFVYDSQTDDWARLPPLPGRRKGAVAAAIDRHVIVTTGSPTGTDPDPQTWVGCCLE